MLCIYVCTVFPQCVYKVVPQYTAVVVTCLSSKPCFLCDPDRCLLLHTIQVELHNIISLWSQRLKLGGAGRWELRVPLNSPVASSNFCREPKDEWISISGQKFRYLWKMQLGSLEKKLSPGSSLSITVLAIRSHRPSKIILTQFIFVWIFKKKSITSKSLNYFQLNMILMALHIDIMLYFIK